MSGWFLLPEPFTQHVVIVAVFLMYSWIFVVSSWTVALKIPSPRPLSFFIIPAEYLMTSIVYVLMAWIFRTCLTLCRLRLEACWLCDQGSCRKQEAAAGGGCLPPQVKKRYFFHLCSLTCTPLSPEGGRLRLQKAFLASGHMASIQLFLGCPHFGGSSKHFQRVKLCLLHPVLASPHQAQPDLERLQHFNGAIHVGGGKKGRMEERGRERKRRSVSSGSKLD
ncbi:hypothetical protein NQZ68_033845 [Dissostichus eleginoides]|nr:hypothetical protein NQZ68_033845 [Dissostichus eleginoides]